MYLDGAAGQLGPERGDEYMLLSDKHGQQREGSHEERRRHQLAEHAVVYVPGSADQVAGMRLMVHARATFRVGGVAVVVNVKSSNGHHRHKYRQQQPSVQLSLPFDFHFRQQR